MRCEPCSAEMMVFFLTAGYSIARNVRLVDSCMLKKRFYSSSVSEDLGCRRGEFSRKHYGSVELVSIRNLSFALLAYNAEL